MDHNEDVLEAVQVKKKILAMLMYLRGGDRTLPCRMRLKMTFFEPEEIESVTLYLTKDQGEKMNE